MVCASGLKEISCNDGNSRMLSSLCCAANRSDSPIAAVEMARRKLDETTMVEEEVQLLSLPTANNALTANSSRSSTILPLPNLIFSFCKNLRNPIICFTPLELSAESKNQLSDSLPAIKKYASL